MKNETKIKWFDYNLREQHRFIIELHVTETSITPVITSFQQQANDNVVIGGRVLVFSVGVVKNKILTSDSG